MADPRALFDVKKTKTIKSNSIKLRGLKGRNPSALEKVLANKIGDIGCIYCLNKKWYTSDMAKQESTRFVSLHHIEGRTKEWIAFNGTENELLKQV